MSRATRGAVVMVDSGRPADSSTQRSRLDITLIATLILFGLLLLKVYGVAGFNVGTATTLVATQPVSVVVGTIALYSSLFIALIAAVSVYIIFVGWKVDESLRKWF